MKGLISEFNHKSQKEISYTALFTQVGHTDLIRVKNVYGALEIQI